jgi:hypothetical protein
LAAYEDKKEEEIVEIVSSSANATLGRLGEVQTTVDYTILLVQILKYDSNRTVAAVIRIEYFHQGTTVPVISMRANRANTGFTRTDNHHSMTLIYLAESWLPNMGGTAEFGWGLYGPRGTGRA